MRSPITAVDSIVGEIRSILAAPLGFLHHLISLFARASTSGGIVTPIRLAVLKLMMNSNFVGGFSYFLKTLYLWETFSPGHMLSFWERILAGQN